jgi:hypothetical protein
LVVPCEKKLSQLIFFGAFLIWRQKSQVSATATLPFPAIARKSSVLKPFVRMDLVQLLFRRPVRGLGKA